MQINPDDRPASESVEGPDDMIDLPRVFFCKGSHDELRLPVLTDRLDVPVLLEAKEGATNRSTAHTYVVGQFGFDDPGSRRQRST